jgi:hypothetical protein
MSSELQQNIRSGQLWRLKMRCRRETTMHANCCKVPPTPDPSPPTIERSSIAGRRGARSGYGWRWQSTNEASRELDMVGTTRIGCCGPPLPPPAAVRSSEARSWGRGWGALRHSIKVMCACNSRLRGEVGVRAKRGLRVRAFPQRRSQRAKKTMEAALLPLAPPHPDCTGRCSASPDAIRPLPARGER